jgi:Fe-S cluster biogenesis protein NfuA
MTAAIKRAAVEAALAEIRPALQADGGDLVLHRITDEGVVSVELMGACGTCPLSIVTMVAGIEMIVKKRVPAVAGVVAHSPVLPNVLDPSDD